MRSAEKLGVKLVATNRMENTLTFSLLENERARDNGKRPLAMGELVWMKHRQTGEERMAAYHGRRDGSTEDILLTWLPKLVSRNTLACTTILGRKTDVRKRKLPLTNTFVQAAVLDQVYKAHTGKRRDMLRQLHGQ
jgi:hypothetical protein